MTIPSGIIAAIAAHMFQAGETIAQAATPATMPITRLARKSPTA